MLFMGVSFISFIEVIDLCVCLVGMRIQRPRQRKVVPNPNHVELSRIDASIPSTSASIEVDKEGDYNEEICLAASGHTHVPHHKKTKVALPTDDIEDIEDYQY